LEFDLRIDSPDPVDFYVAVYDEHQKIVDLELSEKFAPEVYKISLNWPHLSSRKELPFDQTDVQQLRFFVSRDDNDVVFSWITYNWERGERLRIRFIRFCRCAVKLLR